MSFSTLKINRLILTILFLITYSTANADIVSEIRQDNATGFILVNWIQETSEDTNGTGIETALEYDATTWLTLRSRYTDGNFEDTHEYFDISTNQLVDKKFKNPFKVSTLGARFGWSYTDDLHVSIQVDALTRTRDGRKDIGYRLTPIMTYQVSPNFSIRGLLEFEQIKVDSVNTNIIVANINELNETINSSEAAIYLDYAINSNISVDVKIATGLSEDSGDFTLEPHFYYHFSNGVSVKGYTSPEFDLFGIGVNYYFK